MRTRTPALTADRFIGIFFAHYIQEHRKADDNVTLDGLSSADLAREFVNGSCPLLIAFDQKLAKRTLVKLYGEQTGASGEALYRALKAALIQEWLIVIKDDKQLFARPIRERLNELVAGVGRREHRR